MSFTIKCNNCGEEQEMGQGDNRYGDDIEIWLTEECGFQGCVVESIDLNCRNCDNEINI